MEEQPTEINLNIKTLSTKVLAIKVNPQITVAELKEKLTEQHQVPSNGLRLIFHGKVLKDNQTLVSCSIKEGSTIHMVPRPAGATDSTPSTPTGPTEPAPSTNSPAPSARGAPRTIATPGIMLGTITIPDGQAPPDINQILGPVLNSLGLPPQLISSISGQAAQQPNQNNNNNAPVDGLTQVNNLMTTLSNNIQTMQQSVTAGTSTLPTATTETPNTPQVIGQLLTQLNGYQNTINPYLQRLSQLLEQEPELHDQAQRTEAQQLAEALGPLQQQIGVLNIILAHSVSSLQMGNAPGQARAESPGQQQRHVIAPSSNISIHIQNDVGTIPGTTPATNTVQMSVPMFAVRQQQQSPAAGSAQGTQPGAQQGPTVVSNVNPSNLFATLSALSRNQQPTTPQTPTTPSVTSSPAAQTPAPTATTGQPANPLGQMMQSLFQQPEQLQSMMQAVAPMMGQLLGNQPSGGQPGANPLNQLFSMMGARTVSPGTGNAAAANPIQQTFDAHNATATPSGAPTTPSGQPVPFNGPVPTPSNVSNPVTANLLSHTFQAVNQAINNPNSNQSVSSVLGSIANATNTPDDEEEEGFFNDILKKLLDTLTMPDLLSLMNGNWTPMQTSYPTLHNYLKELTNNDLSPNGLAKLTNEIMDSINASMTEESLHPEVKKRVKPGFELTAIGRHTFRKYINKLLTLIAAPSNPSEGNPHPFAIAIKDWCAQFVGELVTLMSQALIGGVADASIVIKLYLQDRMTFLGPEFSQMGTNMVTSYIMNTYSSTANNNNQQQTTEITNDPTTWNTTIAVDEIRQAEAGPQRPQSDAYQSGAPAKKRKTKVNGNTNVDNLAVDRLKEAQTASQAVPNGSQEDPNNNNKKNGKEEEEILKKFSQSSIAKAYRQQLLKDLSERTKTDPDFDPKKFPASSNL